MRAQPFTLAALAALLAASPALAATAAAAPAAATAADVKSGVDAWTRGDYLGAIRRWEGPAARGDADAQFNLAQAYKLGKGVPRDMKKAADLYARAALQGHLQAADVYGILLFQTTRQTEAMPWLKASAARGEPRAMYILGVAHFNGDFVGKDWVRAYALMTRAAASGLPQAAATLATMDGMIPIEQRQMGVSLAADLEQRAQAARSRQFAAADLGVPTDGPTATTPLRAVTPAAPLASAPIPASESGRSAITGAPLTDAQAPSSGVTAGADYANPVTLPQQQANPRRIVVSPKGMMAATATGDADTTATKMATKPATPKIASPKPALSGGWRVQLGAFGQKSNADAMWNRVKARPAIAGHARLDIPVGSVDKLQAGGYATQGDAERACAALKAAAITCIAVKS